MILKKLTKILAVALALLVSAAYIPGIEVSGVYIAIIIALMLGVLNLIIKPIIYILTLPINILTLGLFSVIINAFLFWIVSTFIQGFSIDGFLPAILGSLLVSFISWIIEKTSGESKKAF